MRILTLDFRLQNSHRTLVVTAWNTCAKFTNDFLSHFVLRGFSTVFHSKEVTIMLANLVM